MQGLQMATGCVEMLQWASLAIEVYKNGHQFQTVDALREGLLYSIQYKLCLCPNASSFIHLL